MATRRTPASEREQLELFRALPGDMRPRDARDLMAYPFFSLSKQKRIAPIDFAAGSVRVRVEAVPEHGMATIWDADVLIWAASQLVAARDRGLPTSRLMSATPHEILIYTGRGTASDDYRRLRAALDRLQSTTVATSLHQADNRRMHRFSWVNEWREIVLPGGRSGGLELILPDWFYSGVLSDALVLGIDPRYFRLTGGIERWLYRLVRRHGGTQRMGWRFEMRHLYAKSGSRARYTDFALDVRRLAQRQSLPGYRLRVARVGGVEQLFFYREPTCVSMTPAP